MKQKFTFITLLTAMFCLLHATTCAASDHNGNLQAISDRLYTSGTLSADQLAALKASGVTAVIDLRRPAEGIDMLRTAASELDLGYTNLPMGRALPDAQTMAGISSVISQTAPGKVLLHCASGHRAGIAAALYLQQQGSSPEAAVASAAAAGTRSDGITQLRDHFARLQSGEAAAAISSSQQ
ncbi:MAG: tyrosine-protein phosphatase [Gammaproteobacteria bacterium]|nr:tyrosine-protein phosphatase [Gammaproteobacteria bacterium]